MKAAILRAHGEADQIEYGDWPDPVAGPGDVVIDVRAASLNRRDWWIMRNPERVRRRASSAPTPPASCARSGAGVTRWRPATRCWSTRHSAGATATTRRPADFEIFGIPRQGVFAEQAMPARGVRVPEAGAPVVRRAPPASASPG